MFPNSETENKAGRREKGEGKGVFCRGGGGSGSNFLALIFNIAMIDVIISISKVCDQDDDFDVPSPCLAKQEGTRGECFALLYGAPRSHLTSPHCGKPASSSVEISDRGQ